MKTSTPILLATLGFTSLASAQNYILTYADAIPNTKNYELGTLSPRNNTFSMTEDEYFSGQSDWPFANGLLFSISGKATLSVSFTPGQNLWGLSLTLYNGEGQVIGGYNNQELVKDSATFSATLTPGNYQLNVQGNMTTEYEAQLLGNPNDLPIVDGYPAPYEIYGGSINVSPILPPNLTITQSGISVIISWANSANYTLQQNSNLALPTGWVTSVYTVTTNSQLGTNSITITQPTGSLFFRLSSP